MLCHLMKGPRLHHQEIRVENRSVDLFEPEGPFHEDTALALLKAVHDLAGRGQQDVRVGCRRMTYMDSTGLGILIHLAQETRQKGGRFMLDPQGSKRLRELLKVVNAQFLEDETIDFEQPDSQPHGYRPYKE